MEGSLAKRYSTAFFNIAKKKNKVEELYKEFSDFFGFFNENEKLKFFILAKEVSIYEKTETIKKLFDKQLSPETIHFLFLVLKKKREYLLDSVMYHFRKLYLEYKNIEEARIFSIQKLPDKDLEKIKDILEKITGKKIILYREVDASLIGGIRVQLENTVYDLSIKGYLNRLRSNLLKAEI